MFYCEECRAKNEWPVSMVKSIGRCEICETITLCNDIPSSQLYKTERHWQANWEIPDDKPQTGFVSNPIKDAHLNNFGNHTTKIIVEYDDGAKVTYTRMEE